MRRVLTMYSLGYPRDLLLSLRWAGPPLTPCICVLINSLITTRVRTRGCRGGRRRPASSYTDIEGTGVAIIFGNRTVLPSLHRQQPEYLQQALNVTPARVLAHVRPQRHADQPKKQLVCGTLNVWSCTETEKLSEYALAATLSLSFETSVYIYICIYILNSSCFRMTMHHVHSL